MSRFPSVQLFGLLLLAALPPALAAEPPAGPLLAAVTAAPSAARGATDPADPGYAPTWDTQKHARTYLLAIPAPRGQIVDRNGEPLAITRVSYNLAIAFPTPLNFSERQVAAFVQQQLTAVRSVMGRTITVPTEAALKHYRNRGVVPFVVAQDLRPPELEAFNREKPENLVLQPVYLRQYPQGSLACHILGYAGRAGKLPDGPIENNELLWPNAEGRAGLEQAFDTQLQGKFGQYNISFDATGKRASAEITIPPQPGYNVVTTLDLNLQRLCEQALEKGVKKGAMVITDPGTGDILAMASWPVFNPNLFIPAISTEQFKMLNDDPAIPLLPRAYQSAYPPGSTFKVLVGLAAMQSGKVQPGDEYPCPPAMEIGNLTFRNWKHTDAGSLNFVEALTQSCDTWFYKVGIKIGAQPIVDYAQQFGLGKPTGLPLAAESGGLIPTDDYMLKVHKRKLGGGDVANLSIGQGDTLVTPLQLAQAMAAVGNGGTVFQTRLVQQVQSLDGQIVNAFNVRMKAQVELDRQVIKAVRKGMVDVVSAGLGTAHAAQIKNVSVAGKTGTAQWGPKNKERTAAWFSGFAPADDPKYAFAVVYEGEAGNNDVHGGSSAAPIVGRVLREVFRDSKPQKAKKKSDDDADDDDGSDPSEMDEPVRRPRQEAPPPTPPPAQAPPPKKSFWKKLFG